MSEPGIELGTSKPRRYLVIEKYEIEAVSQGDAIDRAHDVGRNVESRACRADLWQYDIRVKRRLRQHDDDPS